MITHALKAGDSTRLRPRPSLQPATVLDFLVAWKGESCATGMPWSERVYLGAEPFLGPAAVHAQGAMQASITGIVQDSSGAVLPGVTVEVSSPVLIERARAAVTDATGRYRLTNLPAGTYTSPHAARVQHRAPGGTRVVGVVHGDGKPQSAGGHPRGDGHGHRGGPGRGCVERAAPAGHQ